LKNEVTKLNRRNFLSAAPAAAFAGLTVAEMLPKLAQAQAAPMTESNFLVISTPDLSANIKELEAKPDAASSKRLYNDKNFMLDLWVEKTKAGKEYEWHEGRDHIIEILDGETNYEVGGTPKGAHQTGPGEWLAPEAEGVTKMTLKKGDLLILRRGTLHKRITEKRVVLTLTAPVTPRAS
jgi:hypothetical protein